MENVQSSMERRLDELAHELRKLAARVDDMEHGGQLRRPRLSAQNEAQAAEDAPSTPASSILKQLTGATLLSTVATVSFLLAVALVLRTLVDSSVINRAAGAYVGLSYAIGMMMYGYHRYSRAHQPVPIYTICGLVMLFAIILETRIRFEVIPANLGYALLAVTVVATAFFGKRHRVPSVIAFGVLGATSAGLALEFPHPDYSYLGPLVLLATLAAYSAANTLQWRWMSWAMFIYEATFWLMWMLKARAIQLNPEIGGHPTTLTWYLPILAAFLTGHALAVLLASVSIKWPFGFYERAMPSLTGVGAFALARFYLVSSQGRLDLLGLTAVVVAVGYSCIAMWLSTRQTKGLAAAPAWMFAALPLLMLGSPAAFQSIPLIIVLWATVALGTESLGDRWGSMFLQRAGGAFQILACVAAAISGFLFAVAPLGAARLSSLLVAAGICVVHFTRQRKRLPLGSGTATYAAMPLTASLALMLCALVYLFGLFRSVLFWLLSNSPLEIDHTFQCAQSMMIHGSALGMAILALARKDRLILMTAFIIASIGAVKLFGFDLVHCHGLPLVINVSLFGVTAATGSIVWKRWQPPGSNVLWSFIASARITDSPDM